jgi:hypothetical protein
MIPMIVIVILCWACSGAVTSIKAARASGSGGTREGATASGKSNSGTGGSPSGKSSAKPLGVGDVTFGQWQRSLYGRWQSKLRSHLPGQRHGKKIRDLASDVTAATVAGAAVFGMGWASGAAWAGARWAQRDFRKKVEREFGSSDRRSTTGNNRRRPGAPGSTAGRGRRTSKDTTAPRGGRGNTPDNEVIDAEIIDGAEPSTPAPSQFDSAEYADVVLPELLANNPTASPTALNGHTMAAEILTIHDLFRWAKDAFTYAVTAVEQSTIRANSAIERAGHALVRSSSATARAENAHAVAGTAIQHATHLEETAARFSTLRMDAASMTSIGAGITTAVGLAQAERRKAEAQAVVAEIAASLAAAEQAAAEAEQASAQAAILHAEAVKGMHDTVQSHQGPHSEAQSMTGNAAAHESVLAAN